MRIELEFPFKELWKFGYLVTNSENRKHVFLYNSKNDRTTCSYARYLMSVHLGRLLEKHEHVDHKDEDKTNDVIENLQILTQEENSLKHAEYKRSIGKVVILIMNCPVCQREFSRSQKRIDHALNRNPNVVITCSKKCSAKVKVRVNVLTRNGFSSPSKNKKQLSQLQHELIKDLRAEGKSDYQISDITGISRPKIQRHRKEHDIS